VELAFVCMGKKFVSAESAKYFLNVEFVLRNVVRIDEDVIKIYDDYDVIIPRRCHSKIFEKW